MVRREQGYGSSSSGTTNDSNDSGERTPLASVENRHGADKAHARSSKGNHERDGVDTGNARKPQSGGGSKIVRKAANSARVTKKPKTNGNSLQVDASDKTHSCTKKNKNAKHFVSIGTIIVGLKHVVMMLLDAKLNCQLRLR